MGFWVSSSLTSIRETKSVFRQQSGRISSSETGINAWVAQRQALAIQEQGYQLSRAELFAQYKAEQQYNQREDIGQISTFKKLVNSKAFKILSLAIPSMYFGGFALIGAIQIATAFGSKIINAPKTISQYRTTIHAIKEGIRQAAPIKQMARAAGVDPQIMLKQMKILTKYGVPSTRTIARVNPNPMIGVDISVEDYVNSKLEPINPALAYAPITSTVTYAPAQSVANLEAQIELLKIKMQTSELLSKAREISSNLEQKMAVSAKKVSIIIESDTLIPQPDLGGELKIWAHMVGSPNEKVIYIPSGANAEEINFEIRRQLKLARDVPELRIMFERDGELINLASEPDIIINDIVGTTERLRIVPEMAMWGDRSIAYDDDIVAIPDWLYDETFNYETQLYQMYPGYRASIAFLANKFEGTGNIVEYFNTMEKAQTLGSVFTVIGSIAKKLNLFMPEALSSGSLGKWFEKQFFGKVSSTDIIQILKEKGAVAEDISAWEDHWRNYFDKRFEVGFHNSPSGDTGDVNSYIEYIRDFALYNIIFDKILESHIIEGKTISIEDLPDAFDKFLGTYSFLVQNDLREIENEIVRYFASSKGLNKLFQKISESFFDDVRSDFMSFDRKPSTFIGDVLESTIFMNGLFELLAKEFADSDFSNFDIFSWVEFNPKGPVRGDFYELIGDQDALIEIFEILDNGIASESDGPYNARLYDLLVAIFPDLVISFHAKNNRDPKDLKIQDIASDELSTILVDLLLHIRETLNTRSWSVPIKKHTSYSIQTFASSRFDASQIFGAKLQMTSMGDLQHKNGDRKSILTSLYKFKVAKLINSYLREDTTINSKHAAIDKIQGLFDDWVQVDDININLFSEIREELYDLARDIFYGKSFTKGYIESVINTFTNEENLNRMLQITSSGTFELIKYEAIDFLFDSGEKLSFDDIPANLFTIIGGKKVDFDRTRFNYIVNQRKKALLVVRDINTGELGVIGSDIVNDLSGNIREGYAYFDSTTNKEIVFPNIYLSNPEGNRLISKVDFDASGFTVRSGGDEWFRWLLMGVESINGLLRLNYYRALGWATGNRFIAFLQEVEDNIMTVPAYQSLIIVDKIKNSPKWLKNLREQENSFLDPEFNSHVNRDFILDNSKQFLDRLSLLTDLYVDTSSISRYLPIDNYDLQILGAYEDENGLLNLGPGYDDIELSFRTFLVHYLAQFGDTVKANEFTLELCSLKKIKEGSPITVQNVAFNYDQTRKQFLQKWVDVFRLYQYRDSNSLVIKKMNEIIIGREKNFIGESNEFDFSQDNEKFNEREILLAKRVVSVLIDLFGSYMFKEMFSGGILMKDGTVRFMSLPWNELYKINKEINTRFSIYRGGRLSFTHVRHRYVIDKFTSSLDIALPTSATVVSTDATISLPGVPVKFVLPMYKKPVDKTLHSSFYKVISSEIYKLFEANDRVKRVSFARSWRSQFYKTLMKICADRGYNSLQMSLHDEGFRLKIFTQRITGKVFREQAFDWLTSRGEYSITLVHGKGDLRLTPADFHHYFKDDWAKFASSLQLTAAPIDMIESDLRYMEDFIMDMIAFIFELAENAKNQRIALYPFNAHEDGYVVNSKNNFYLPPQDEDLAEWYFNIYYPKNIGFLLDLNDQNSVNKFIEMIPILLGNLLVRPAAFIVREPYYDGLESDQCTFAFGMSGSLMPSQMIGRLGFSSPPETGMRWVYGDEIDYRKSDFYLKWNEIISKHNTLSVHKLNDPNDFYDLCRRILWIFNI